MGSVTDSGYHEIIQKLIKLELKIEDHGKQLEKLDKIESEIEALTISYHTQKEKRKMVTSIVKFVGASGLITIFAYIASKFYEVFSKFNAK